MKTTFFLAAFAAVATAATTKKMADDVRVAQVEQVYARQAGIAGAATGGAPAPNLGTFLHLLPQTPKVIGSTISNREATGSLLALVEKIAVGLGEKVPELKEPAEKVKVAIDGFAKAAKDIKPEAITKGSTE